MHLLTSFGITLTKLHLLQGSACRGQGLHESKVKGMDIKMKKKIIGSFAGFLLAGMIAGCNGVEHRETVSEEVQSTEADIETQQKQREAARIDPMEELLKDYYGDYQEKGGDCLCVRRRSYGWKL